MSLNFDFIVGFIMWSAFCVILTLLDTRVKIEEAFRAGHMAGEAYGYGQEWSGDADYSYGQWTMRGM